VGGPLLIDGHLKVGYDTAGLREYLRTGATDTRRLLDGFYVDDSTHLTVRANLTVHAGVGVGLELFGIGAGAYVTANGGVSTGDSGNAPVRVTLHDPNADGDGKLHLNEVGGTLFDTSGEIDAGLSIHLRAGVKHIPLIGDIGFDKTITEVATGRLIDLNGRSIPNPF
jgi:hypothetical protein